MVKHKTFNADEHDTPHWRQYRDDVLMEMFENADAVSLLISISSICEIVDDIIDKDKPYNNETIVSILYKALIDIPSNPIWEKFKYSLIPLLLTSISSFELTLKAESRQKLGTSNEEDVAFGYVRRYDFHNIVCYLLAAIKGRDYMRDNSEKIWNLMVKHETIKEYNNKIKGGG